MLRGRADADLHKAGIGGTAAVAWSKRRSKLPTSTPNMPRQVFSSDFQAPHGYYDYSTVSYLARNLFSCSSSLVSGIRDLPVPRPCAT